MRSTIQLCIVGVVAVGCYPGAAPRGVTRAEYAGTTTLVFTNATPQRMCGLSMSADAVSEYGDNWLPEDGLASGASLELRVKPGTYKATWVTCRSGTDPYYAGTLYREFAFAIDRQETQLYAFVSDAIVPTKRAATLGRQFKLVRAAGQPIEPAMATRPAVPSYAEQEILGTNATPSAPVSKVTKIKLHDCIDYQLVAKTRSMRQKKPNKTRANIASVRRDVDVINDRIGLRQR